MNFSTRQADKLNIMERGAFPSLLIVLFVAGCIFWLPSGVINLREQELIFPLVGIALFLAGSIFLKVNKAVGLLLAFVVIYTVTTFTPDGYRFLLMIIVFAYLYQSVALNYSEIIKHKELIFNLICIFALINVLWLVLQHNGIFLFFKPKAIYNSLETGFFANRNEVSVFLACCLPFFFRGKWHYGIILIIAGLVIAQTCNGFIGAAIALVIYGLSLAIKKGFSKPLCIAGAIAFIIISVGSYMFLVHSGGISQRLGAFTKSLELVKEKPLLGWGVNQGKYVVPLYLNGDRQDKRYVAYAYNKVIYKDDFKKVYLENPERYKGDNNQWIHLHNDYLQFTIEAGIIGLIGLIIIIFAHAIAFFRTKQKDLIIGLSVLCLLWTANAFFTFQIGRFSFLTVFFLALIQGAYLKQEGYKT